MFIRGALDPQPHLLIALSQPELVRLLVTALGRPRLIFLDLAISGKFPDSRDPGFKLAGGCSAAVFAPV